MASASAILDLADHELAELAKGLRNGRFGRPVAAGAVAGLVGTIRYHSVTDWIMRWEAAGLSAVQIAEIVDLVAENRAQRPEIQKVMELVFSGPSRATPPGRQTSAVVNELFSQATRSVVVAGYAVRQGQQIFRALADRMLALPDLDVQILLNVGDEDQPLPNAGERISRFSVLFFEEHWPVHAPRPRLLCYLASPDAAGCGWSAFHAKVVVTDASRVFVSSANFTGAAQDRNVEVGVLLDSPPAAQQILNYFAHLLAVGLLAEPR